MVSWKNLSFRGGGGGSMKDQYIGGRRLPKKGVLPKKGSWTICRFKGESLARKRGGGDDTPIHTMWNMRSQWGIYLHKANNRNTRTRCEIWSKLTIKTLCFNVSIVNFEHAIADWETLNYLSMIFSFFVNII